MDCDIHIVLERKNEYTDGKWVGVRELSGFHTRILDLWGHKRIGFKLKRRDYDFFNEIAGVRGDGSSFGYEPRGVPDDASDLTRMYLNYWGADAHSESWLTAEELQGPLVMCKGGSDKEVAKLVAARMADPLGNIEMVASYLDDDISKENAHEWRIVFWFDN